VIFERAFTILMQHEGGYSNDPLDPGGETRYGISKRAYPHLKIAELTMTQAAEIYRKDYWDAIRADELPPYLRLPMFDCAVNQGVKTSVLLLQKALGVREDGVLGNVTLAGAKVADARRLLKKVMANRAYRYAHHHEITRFGRGWFDRCFDVHARAIEVAAGVQEG
jgi:lysozyme family protein